MRYPIGSDLKHPHCSVTHVAQITVDSYKMESAHVFAPQDLPSSTARLPPSPARPFPNNTRPFADALSQSSLCVIMLLVLHLHRKLRLIDQSFYLLGSGCFSSAPPLKNARRGCMTEPWEKGVGVFKITVAPFSQCVCPTDT